MLGQKKWVKFFLITLLAIILAFYFLMIFYISQGGIEADFVIFYGSAQNFFDGRDIYAPVPFGKYGEVLPEVLSILGRDSLYPNLNPPFQTLLFLPLPLIDIQHAYLVFAFLSILLGLIAVRIIEKSKLSKPAENERSLLSGILLFAFFPTIAAICEGQVTLLILFLLVVGWSASRSGNDRAAGLALGLALSLKLFTGLFIFYFLIRRRWKLLAWYLGTFLVTSFLALMVFGIDAYFRYMESFKDINWYELSWNASFTGFFTRLFEGTSDIIMIYRPDITNIAVLSFSLIALITLVWAAWPRDDAASDTRFDLGYALTIVLMLLISPFGWLYYFPFLIIPAILILRISSQSRNHFLKSLRLMPSVEVKMSAPPQRIQVNESYKLAQIGFYTYVLVAFAVLLAWLIFKLQSFRN